MKKLLLFLGMTLSLFAQSAYIEQTLGNSAGDAVSIDREWAVVGDAAGNKAHLYKLDYSTFRWGGWNALTAPKQGRFGASVALYDSTQSRQIYRAITTNGTPGFSDEIKPYQGFWIRRNSVICGATQTLSLPFEK